MANKPDDTGLKSRPDDLEVWLRPAIKPDGEEYYEYLLMYVDNILAIAMNLTEILKIMEWKTVKYKNVKIAQTEMYQEEMLKRK